MKNYFEILEVDIHASSEVIDKAFKILAKKYHPDTQQEEKKAWAEEQFKILNEAYEILSDEVKREEYVKQLEVDKNRELNLLMLKNADLEVQLEELQAELDAFRHAYANSSYQAEQYQTSSYSQTNIPNSRNTNYSSQKEYITPEPSNYYEAYYPPIKSKLKSFVAFCITLAIIVFIGFLLWKIPFTHNMLVQLYENNSAFQSLFNLFHK